MIKKAKNKIVKVTRINEIKPADWFLQRSFIFSPNVSPVIGISIIAITVFLSWKTLIDTQVSIIKSSYGVFTLSGALILVGVFFIVAPFIALFFAKKN